MKVEGQCHCGAIAYEAEVGPDAISLCHCADCQMMSGSAFRSNVTAPAAHFKMIRGEPRRYVKVADSGTKRVQAFCETCGTPVYSSAHEDHPSVYILRLGALKQRHELGGPWREVWTRGRLPWLRVVDGVREVHDRL